MRSFRLICALVLAASLAILPVSAAFAMTQMGKSEAGMVAAGDDCPCCKPAKADGCFLKCCHLHALAVDGMAIAKPRSLQVAEFGTVRFAALVSGPEPPPPRS
jgi:hypothetical protein